QLMRRGERLITLLGPGGTGKTRLALELARQQVSSFTRGVWVADLTEAHDVDGVCLAVGKALNVPLTAGKTSSDVVDLLGHAIEGRGELLLLFDNFEQVVGSAEATVGRWIEQAPKAKFLATSREVLRLADEAIYEVPPLK